jgi:hypothetical protein
MPTFPAPSAGRQASVMRITIDEQARLVHVLKGAAMLTLALPHAKTREALEAAAWGLEMALANATVIVVDGKPITLRERANSQAPRAPGRR